MPIPIPPETRILELMKQIAVDADLHTTFELAEPFTVRHFRHRNTHKKERPGIALLLVESEIDNERGPYHTSSEQCWAMTVRVLLDMEFLSEKAHDLPASDENDATGWDRILGVGRTLAGHYVMMDGPLRTLVDDVLYGDIDPDEDSKPDEGRLAFDIIVLYRTHHEDPMLLLGPGENA